MERKKLNYFWAVIKKILSSLYNKNKLEVKNSQMDIVFKNEIFMSGKNGN